MTTYPTAPPPQAAFGFPGRKPTDVMGKRIGAYFIDGIIVGGITIGIIFGMLAAFKPTAYQHLGTHEAAVQFCDAYDRNPDIVAEKYRGRDCSTSGDRAELTDGGKVGAAVGIGIGISLIVWLLNYMVLEGLAGGTLGKLIVGIRTIREDGARPGLGWALLRNVLLVIPDQIFAGLVGLIVALTNDDHQRVGDMAASTYVVDKWAAGRPVHQPPPGFAGYAAPGQGHYQQPAPSAPRNQGGWGVPGTTGAQQPSTAAPGAQHQPQWDQARNTYIWWNDKTQQWLEHDRASGEWRPISQ